jgi:hypothetical protein
MLKQNLNFIFEFSYLLINYSEKINIRKNDFYFDNYFTVEYLCKKYFSIFIFEYTNKVAYSSTRQKVYILIWYY